MSAVRSRRSITTASASAASSSPRKEDHRLMDSAALAIPLGGLPAHPPAAQISRGGDDSPPDSTPPALCAPAAPSTFSRSQPSATTSAIAASPNLARRSTASFSEAS
eukprot:scaffold19152_cov62-Isochrysis_galbana.AAC.1